MNAVKLKGSESLIAKKAFCILNEIGVSPSSIKGTGKNGKITLRDVYKFIQYNGIQCEVPENYKIRYLNILLNITSITSMRDYEFIVDELDHLDLAFLSEYEYTQKKALRPLRNLMLEFEKANFPPEEEDRPFRIIRIS